MSQEQDFGEPLGSDLLLEIGTLYLRRRLLTSGVRALMSGVPPDVAEATLQIVLGEIRPKRALDPPW